MTRHESECRGRQQRFVARTKRALDHEEKKIRGNKKAPAFTGASLLRKG
jgi:hypothetical protein